MSDQSVVVQGTSNITIQNNSQPIKPMHLIVLNSKVGIGKNSKLIKFISIDQPDMQISFIKFKGFLTELDEEIIAADYKKIVQDIDKVIIQELYYPWHQVAYVRNLVFKSK